MLATGRLRWVLLLLLLIAAAACRGDQSAPDTTVGSDLDPVSVVEELLTAVMEGRFEDTAVLTDQRQAGLLALAEGSEVSEVVEALDADAAGVAANFWSGFAQTLDPSFTMEGADVDAGEPVERGGARYVDVVLTDADGDARTFYLRDDGGWKVDLLATFAPVVAERLTPRVEALLTSANPDASVVVAMLNRFVPSLEVAASGADLDPAAHQSLLALIERITRAG